MSIEQLIHHILSITSLLINNIVLIKMLRSIYFKAVERLEKENSLLIRNNEILKDNSKTLESYIESGEDFIFYASNGKKYLVKTEGEE